EPGHLMLTVEDDGEWATARLVVDDLDLAEQVTRVGAGTVRGLQAVELMLVAEAAHAGRVRPLEQGGVDARDRVAAVSAGNLGDRERRVGHVVELGQAVGPLRRPESLPAPAGVEESRRLVVVRPAQVDPDVADRHALLRRLAGLLILPIGRP